MLTSSVMLNGRNDLNVYAALPGAPAVAAGRQHDSSLGAGSWCPQRGGRGEERGRGLSTGSEQLHSPGKTRHRELQVCLKPVGSVFGRVILNFCIIKPNDL